MRPIDFAVRQLENRPEIANNPLAQEWLEVVRTNDAKRGEEIAKNLCDNSGVTVRQALDEARRFFKV